MPQPVERSRYSHLSPLVGLFRRGSAPVVVGAGGEKTGAGAPGESDGGGGEIAGSLNGGGNESNTEEPQPLQQADEDHHPPKMTSGDNRVGGNRVVLTSDEEAQEPFSTLFRKHVSGLLIPRRGKDTFMIDTEDDSPMPRTTSSSPARCGSTAAAGTSCSSANGAGERTAPQQHEDINISSPSSAPKTVSSKCNLSPAFRQALAARLAATRVAAARAAFERSDRMGPPRGGKNFSTAGPRPWSDRGRGGKTFSEQSSPEKPRFRRSSAFFRPPFRPREQSSSFSEASSTRRRTSHPSAPARVLVPVATTETEPHAATLLSRTTTSAASSAGPVASSAGPAASSAGRGSRGADKKSKSPPRPPRTTSTSCTRTRTTGGVLSRRLRSALLVSVRRGEEDDCPREDPPPRPKRTIKQVRYEDEALGELGELENPKKVYSWQLYRVKRSSKNRTAKSSFDENGRVVLGPLFGGEQEEQSSSGGSGE